LQYFCCNLEQSAPHLLCWQVLSTHKLQEHHLKFQESPIIFKIVEKFWHLPKVCSKLTLVTRLSSYLLTASAALLFTSCSLSPPQPTLEDQRISLAPYHNQTLKGSTIQKFGADRTVQVFNDSGAGLATMITPDGYYLTALHVIEGSQSVIFATIKDQRPLLFKNIKKGSKIELDPTVVAPYEVKTVCLFPKMDLALVKSRALAKNSFRLSKNRPARNSVVFSAANPFVNQTAAGMVYATRKFESPSNVKFHPSVMAWDVYSSAPLRQGDSGGPLFNKQGNLVAVNVSIAMKKGSDKGFHHSQSTMVLPSELQKIIARDRRNN